MPAAGRHVRIYEAVACADASVGEALARGPDIEAGALWHRAGRGVRGSAPRRRAHEGRVDFNKASLLREKGPIDPSCECFVCQKYQRAYIAHLVRANEITGGALITFHNLFFFNAYVATLREKIAKGVM